LTQGLGGTSFALLHLRTVQKISHSMEVAVKALRMSGEAD
jgi:hypothetical protein